MNTTIYLKLNAHSKVQEKKVYLKNLAEVYCGDKVIENKAKVVVVTRIKRCGARKVLSVLYIMEQIAKELPGIEVKCLGETDAIVEWEKKNKLEALKVLFISLISFFGTGFTIMAFHNDIGIRDVFGEIYHLTSGSAPDGVGVLEISYCIGLFVGITVFFNHIGKKKFTSDPTPVAVAMHNYERDVNQAIIENAERRGEEDVE